MLCLFLAFIQWQRTKYLGWYSSVPNGWKPRPERNVLWPEFLFRENSNNVFGYSAKWRCVRLARSPRVFPIKTKFRMCHFSRWVRFTISRDGDISTPQHLLMRKWVIFNSLDLMPIPMPLSFKQTRSPLTNLRCVCMQNKISKCCEKTEKKKPAAEEWKTQK